jgi:hypothetical protein
MVKQVIGSISMVEQQGFDTSNRRIIQISNLTYFKILDLICTLNVNQKSDMLNWMIISIINILITFFFSRLGPQISLMCCILTIMQDIATDLRSSDAVFCICTLPIVFSDQLLFENSRRRQIKGQLLTIASSYLFRCTQNHPGPS